MNSGNRNEKQQLASDRGFNPEVSPWTPVEDKKGGARPGPDANNWRAQQGKPAPFKGNNQWGKGNQGGRQNSNNRGNNNNNNNNNNRNGSRWGNSAVGRSTNLKTTEVKPVVLPTSGPLFDFLEAPEAPCFDVDYTDKLKNLDCKLEVPHKWILWTETAENSSGVDAPTREDYLKTLVQSKPFTNLDAIRSEALLQAESSDNAKILLFKQGVKPVWEDRGNYNGGRFFVACSSKTVAVNTFITLVIKLLAGKVLVDEELNGVVVSLTGTNKFAVQVWNRNSSEKDKIKTARKTMKKLFKKNVNYHVHRTSLKINKYGLDAVLPEIEKAEAEKAEKKAAEAKELEKAQEITVVSEQPSEVVEEVKADETIVDTMAKAAMAAAISAAWENRN